MELYGYETRMGHYRILHILPDILFTGHSNVLPSEDIYFLQLLSIKFIYGTNHISHSPWPAHIILIDLVKLFPR